MKALAWTVVAISILAAAVYYVVPFIYAELKRRERARRRAQPMTEQRRDSAGRLADRMITNGDFPNFYR